MAFAPVNLAGELWRSAGIDFFLANPEQLEGSRNKTPADQPGNKKEHWKPRSYGDRESGAISGKTFVQETQGQADGNVWQPRPLTKWPAEWQRQLEKTAKCRFAWTYFELGADLLGNEMPELARGRKERGNFLRALFQELQLPARSNGLWPVTLRYAENSGQELEGDLFWSGLFELDCMGAIVFGSRAVERILPGRKLKPLSFLREKGRFILVLWDINGLASNPGLHGELRAYLRSYFHQIGASRG